MRLPLTVLVSTALLAGACLPTAALADASVKTRLEARGIKFEVDDDGDYKVTYNYASEGRTQLVFVSGRTESVGGFQIREVFAPAALIEDDDITGARAVEMLEDSRTRKIGAWEIGGGALYFVIKIPDSVDAASLESAMDIVAETADDMEIKLSGDRDSL